MGNSLWCFGHEPDLLVRAPRVAKYCSPRDSVIHQSKWLITYVILNAEKITPELKYTLIDVLYLYPNALNYLQLLCALICDPQWDLGLKSKVQYILSQILILFFFINQLVLGLPSMTPYDYTISHEAYLVKWVTPQYKINLLHVWISKCIEALVWTHSHDNQLNR